MSTEFTGCGIDVPRIFPTLCIMCSLDCYLKGGMPLSEAPAFTTGDDEEPSPEDDEPMTFDEDFNDNWAEKKNEAARLEGLQECGAFLSDPDFQREQQELAADIRSDPERQVAQTAKDLALCARLGLMDRFPAKGRFEDNIYRPSAYELTAALPEWEPIIDGMQLVLVKTLAPDAKVKCYTSIHVGQIAQGTGEDSIRVVREDAGRDGRVFRFKNLQDWITRRVPSDVKTNKQAAAHLAAKVENQVAQFTRACPECGKIQVKCKAGDRFWWRGTSGCRCKIEDGW